MDPHRHTWPGGRCPDGQDVPEPARPAPAASWYERARVVAVLLLALVAAVVGALR